MKSQHRLLQTLQEYKIGLCDDCLSEKPGIFPRQRIYQLANELSQTERTSRAKTTCSSCGKHKFVNSIMREILLAWEEAAILRATNRRWTWEGNVQSAIATH